jgi:gluconate 2-dehydrogenase gamma chain
MTGPYRFLIEPEVRFLEAAVERLIPTDALGPGARDAGVVDFIDGQLAGPWGGHGRQYRSGPWHEGTPQQGHQSRLVPRDLYRLAIQEIDATCRVRHDAPFHRLPAALQHALLEAIEADALALPSQSSAAFFSLLLRNTMEGFFADPIYGGNRDKVGWRLIGFPGVAASDYPAHLERFDVAYTVEPVSILDITRGLADVDAQGYAKHVLRQTDAER